MIDNVSSDKALMPALYESLRKEVFAFLVEAGINDVEIQEAADWVVLSIPMAADADYQFQIWLYADGEAALGAVLKKIDDQKPGEKYSFWRENFEIYQGQKESVVQRLTHSLIKVLTFPSRIVVKRASWFFWNAGCEVKASNGEWIGVAGLGYFTLGGFPYPFKVKEIEFYAPPIAKQSL